MKIYKSCSLSLRPFSLRFFFKFLLKFCRFLLSFHSSQKFHI